MSNELPAARPIFGPPGDKINVVEPPAGLQTLESDTAAPPPSADAAPGGTREQMTMVAMRISGGFEGDDPWANITGNFDQQGLTCGMLGKTFADGDQQKVVRSYLDQFGQDELLQLMPQGGREYLQLCALPTAQGTAKISAWSVNGNSEKVRAPYLEELRRFWKSPRMVGVQFAAALGRETVFAERYAASWGLDGSLHSFCFFFDIATQSGSLKQITEEDLDKMIQQGGGPARAALNICQQCADADSSLSNARDAHRNGPRWQELVSGADGIALRLFSLAWLRSLQSLSRYVFTSMNRRGTLALGLGYVDETLWNFREELGLIPGPGGVTIRSAVPVYGDVPDLPRGEPPSDPDVEELPTVGPLMRVNASPSLNLRRTPDQASAANILARLPRGLAVRVLDAGESAAWRRVRADVGGGSVEGYVASRYLTASPVADGDTSGSLTSVHLSATARLDRPPDAHPLADPLAPRRDGTTPADRVRELAAIIAYLNVAHSTRYQPTALHTFCNIYAYDYCYLADVYLPRVWWNGQSIARLAQHQSVTPILDQTVDEMRANDLQGWFAQFGPRFGWRQTFEAGELQQAANGGGVGIIVAHHRVESMAGHIVAVPPETGNFRAQRASDGTVVVPLQSQAGRVNFAYGMGRNGVRWWANENTYKAFGFWIHT